MIYFRYKHKSFDGARTWIEPAAGTNFHSFSEVHILGSAQVAVTPLNGLQAPVRFHADRLYGDKSGFLHVGYHQNFSVAVTDPDIPFGLRVYENGSMMLPRRAFLQTVSFKSSGKVCDANCCQREPTRVNKIELLAYVDCFLWISLVYMRIQLILQWCVGSQFVRERSELIC